MQARNGVIVISPISTLTRIKELRDISDNANTPSGYFNGFEERFLSSPARQRVWRQLDRELKKLDDAAWHALKSEATPYLTQRNNTGRGWQQLFTILNQA